MVRELSSKVDQLSSATAPAGPPTAALSPDELKGLADDVAEPGAGETVQRLRSRAAWPALAASRKSAAWVIAALKRLLHPEG